MSSDKEWIWHTQKGPPFGWPFSTRIVADLRQMLYLAKVVFKALWAKEPKRRYSIGHMSGAAAMLESLPQPVADSILAKR